MYELKAEAENMEEYVVEFQYTTHHELIVTAQSPQDALEMVNEKLFDTEKEELKEFLKKTYDGDEDPYYTRECEVRVLWFPNDDDYDDDEDDDLVLDQNGYRDCGVPHVVAIQRSHLENQEYFRSELPFSDAKCLLSFLKNHLGNPESQGNDWYEGRDGVYYDLYKEKDEYKHSLKRMYNIMRKYIREYTITEERTYAKE